MLKRLLQRRSPSAATAALRPEDIGFLTPVRSAQVVEPAPAAMWAVYLLLALLATAIAWAAVAQVDIVVRANARVVPDGREQVIASLEGGILRELKVREGQQVAEGEELALIDPTRFEAQQAEGQAKRLSLLGMVARLEAESVGRELRFPADLAAKSPQVAQGETDSWRARQRALDEAVGITRRNAELLQRELSMAQTLSARGLMSEVEVMRLRRQVNELQLGVQERINRFRLEASSDLARQRTELSVLDEQLVAREDAVERTVLRSPLRGVVKQVRIGTTGGVVAPGAPVLEIVPLGDKVLVEARIRPADIGFVQVGQAVEVKLSAYDYVSYGGLKGTVASISPDALTDGDKSGGETWYRALVRADAPVLQAGERSLPLIPGMTGSVEIRTGQRSVLDFLLLPMVKSREAMRER
jgi:adhesin transport system membrane fusion protein